MSIAAAPIFKSISMANGCLTSISSLFSPKTPYPFLSVPSKSVKILRLFSSHSSSSSSTFPSWVTLKYNLPTSRGPVVALVAQTSDWARQEKEGNEVEEASIDWEKQGDDVESSGEEGEVTGEDEYPLPPEEAKLFIGNLPYDIESADLAELFEKAGIVETAEVIYNRETDQSRGFGFVTMSTVEEAEKAVEMFHRYDINGRLLTVNKAAPRGARVERSPREFGPSFKIYVGNLAWQVDDARLEQVFSEHGKVVEARVVYDRETGRSRGFGFVTMASQTELDDAIAALDGQSLDGRAIRVNAAEERPRRSSF